MSFTSAMLTFVEDGLARWRRHRAEARTRRALAGLSHHMRKDIGWPDPVPDRRRRVPFGDLLS